MKPVPVTLITGFLGAGKSTLVSHVLHAQHGWRIAVVVNELGQGLSVGLERTLVQDSAGAALVEEFVELANGCICCTVKDSFLQTLEGLLEKRDKFDYILVETTGLADPGPVVQALWPDDALEPGAVLDGVVTVVDASHVQQLLLDHSTGELAQLQVAHADVVLLNKTDLVGEADADATVQAIRGINATAEVLRTQRSVVDLSSILNLGTVAAGGSGRRGAPALTNELRAHQRPLLGGRAFARGAQGLAAASAVHDGTIGTVYMEVPGVLDEQQLVAWLEGLLWEPECHGARAQEAPPPQVLRAKGMLCCAPGQPHRILQAVRQTYELTDASHRDAGAPDESRLVLIGRCLDAGRLEATLRGCVRRA